jgi:recombination protein RecT
MQPQAGTFTTKTTPQEIQQQAIERVEKKTALDRIRQYAEMEEVKKRFINLLGDRDGRAYVEAVVIAVANSDALQKCTPKSIMVSAMRAASLKLSVDPILKQAHLVPMGDEATLIVDYHGLVSMTTDTGYYEIPPNVFEVYAGEVIKTDRFSGRVTIEGEKTSDEVIGWCGYFKAKNGTERWLYMDNEKCDTHGEKYSRGYNYKNKRGEFTSMWKKEPDAMRRKTVLRLLVSMWGHFSPHIQRVLMQDEAAIEAQAEDMPEVKEVNSAPDIKTSKEANISILSGNGNPDPIKEETWKEWEAWKARAVAVNIIAPDIDRAVVTDADLRRYINTEISGIVTAAEEA